MYKLLDRIDKMIPLSTLLKRYLNKEIITNEETKDSNQIIFVVGTKGYNAKIYLYDNLKVEWDKLDKLSENIYKLDEQDNKILLKYPRNEDRIKILKEG